jgi:O-antigen ligase
MSDSNSETIYKYPVSFPPGGIGHPEARALSTISLEQVGFFCLLILLAVTATPFGMTNPLWEIILTCTIILLAAIKITNSILLGRSCWGEYKMIMAPLLCLILLSFIQTIPLKIVGFELSGAGAGAWWAISADPSETRRFGFKLLSFVLFGYLLYQYTSNRRRLIWLTHFTICLGVVSALLGIIQGSIEEGPAWVFPYLGYERAFGQFGNRNHFALLMEMTLGLTFGLMAKRGADLRSRVPYLVAAFIISLALVLTTSRGAITSMLGMFLLAGILMTFSAGEKREPGKVGNKGMGRRESAALIMRMMLVGSAFVLFFLAVTWVGGDRLADRFERTDADVVVQNGAVSPKEARIRIWRATVDMIKVHPILGVGFGGYATAIPKYHKDIGELIPYEAHNDYLELQASGGVIGTILVIWFAIEVFKRARINYRSRRPFRRAIAFGSIVGLSGIAIHGLVDSGLHITLNVLVFTILIVLLIATIPKGEEIFR